jgi:hypothetical protein
MRAYDHLRPCNEARYINKVIEDLDALKHRVAACRFIPPKSITFSLSDLTFFYANFLLIYTCYRPMALGLGINLTQVYFHQGNYKYFSQYVLLIEADYIEPMFNHG